MKRLLSLILSLTIFAACGPSPEARATQTAAAWTATPTMTATATFTPSPASTNTPTATATPSPTPLPPFDVWKISPDGARLAGLITGSGRPLGPGFYAAGLDGSAPVQLYAQPVEGFKWSPDSARLAFILPGGGFQRTIAVINADGSNLIQLATGADPNCYSCQAGFDPSVFHVQISVIDFVWSADGSEIIFSARYGNTGQIFFYATSSTRRSALYRRSLTELPQT